MADPIEELMNRSFSVRREYPSRRIMQEFIFDNADLLTREEIIEVLRFVRDTQNTAVMSDVSEGVALNVSKLDQFVIESIYDMFIKFKEAAGSVESLVFD